MTVRIVVVGECMLQLGELKRGATPSALSATMSYGGDTLNTALYLARTGIKSDYVTGLGDDSMSDWMIEQWRSENIGCDMVERFPDSVPGMYLIELDSQGERTFKYWRKGSPAARLFDDAARAERLFSRMMGYPHMYVSGITLALYAEAALESFLGFLERYVQQGGKLFFDGNYRPSLWSSPQAALEVFKVIYAMTDIALSTLDDELLVTGLSERDDVIEQLHAWGVREIALKMGAEGCLISIEGESTCVPTRSVEIVDTTSAGDSFNAAYIAARLQSQSPIAAAAKGNELASVVIQHRGAIIPAESMPL